MDRSARWPGPSHRSTYRRRRCAFVWLPAGTWTGGPRSGDSAPPVSVVRSGRWKLHRFYEDDRHELYDLRADLGETENLADERPEVRRELRDRLDAWLEATGARRPTRRGL